MSQVDAGATGTLTLSAVDGVFINDEALTGSITGAATVNGTLTLVSTVVTTIRRARLESGGLSRWTTLASILPDSSITSGAVAQYNDKVYWLDNDGELHWARIQAGGEFSAWTSVATGFTRTLHGLKVMGKMLVCVGGFTGSDESADVYMAQLEADGAGVHSWFSTEPMLIARSSFGTCTDGDRLWIIGGINSSGTAITNASVARVTNDGIGGSKAGLP